MFTVRTASYLCNYIGVYTAIVKFMDWKHFHQMMTNDWKAGLENGRICMADDSSFWESEIEAGTGSKGYKMHYK